MCGRYKVTAKIAALRDAFSAVVAPDSEQVLSRPRFNAAPTDELPIVRVEEQQRVLRALRWGLIPVWAKDSSIGSKMINARSETVVDKPAFRDALKKRRCLVVTDGFFEWRRVGARKQPYLFRYEDDRPFAFAGLWSSWKGPAGPIETFTVLTTGANALLAPVHDRMPVIVDPADYDEWLDPARSVVDLERLRAPRDRADFVAIPVGPRVGDVRHDDADVITATGPGLHAFARDDDDAPAASATTTAERATPARDRPARTKRATTTKKPDQGSLF